MIRVGLDTNILVYLAGLAKSDLDHIKVDAIRDLIAQLGSRIEFVVATQAYGELYTVLVRNDYSRVKALEILERLQDDFDIASSDVDTFNHAMTFACEHRLQIWDSLIANTCARSGCTLLLSEDMQNGFKIGSMTVANPFLDKRLPALERLLVP